MMKVLKILLKLVLYSLIIPLLYLIISLIFTSITINKKDKTTICENTIYLHTNGIHLNVILPKENIEINLLKDLNLSDIEKYVSFGWGDENFYLNTPTWNDLTFGNAFQAMFLKSTTLMHITRYKRKQTDWIKINISENELKNLNKYILETFKKNETGNIIILRNKGYSKTDDFYQAKGYYSILKTCNSWVNKGFKESGLKSCYWTPFDFGLINKYK